MGFCMPFVHERRRRGGGQSPWPIGNGVWLSHRSSLASDLLLLQMHKHSEEVNEAAFLGHVQYDGRSLMLLRSKAADSHEPSGFWTPRLAFRFTPLGVAGVGNRRRELAAR